jgi:arylsulfatase A-like enzyme
VAVRLAVVGLVLLSLPFVLATGRASAQERPSFVVIVADDLGWGDLGCYGQQRIPTPNVDRLAGEGMRFTQAYAGAAVCAPSRCVLMTGLHGGHCPVDENTYPNEPLRPDEVTIARILRGAGYRTGIAGKWGLGGEFSDGTAWAEHSTPWAQGFGEGLAVLDQSVAMEHWPEWLWIDGERVPVLGNVDDGRARYAPDLFRDEAIAFLERAAAGGEPFFLYWAPTLPHREIVAPGAARFEGEAWPDAERAFASMVARLDEDVGRVLDRLDALGLSGRTLLVLASDNGPNETDGHAVEFFDSNGPFRGRKRDLFEGGIRIPMIARWPGVVPAGTSSERPVGLVDLAPTLADLAEAGVPDGLDGRSLARALRGEGASVARDLYWRCREGDATTRRAIRRGELKLVERDDGRLELYDLARDPGETIDLARQRPADVAALYAALERETSGPTAPVDPILRIEARGVVESGTIEPAGEAVPVLWLRFEEGVPGLPIARARSFAPPGLEAIAGGPTFDAAVALPFVPLTGAANAGAACFDGGAHLAVPPAPALAIGEAFSLEAWVRLDAVGATQWIVAPGSPLGAGVLAQVGDLAWRAAPGSPPAAPRSIAVAFAARSRREEPWIVASTLEIGDAGWHRIVARVEASRATFELDGRAEVVAFEGLGGAMGRGPLLVGAAHDARGERTGGLVGCIDELRLSRGIVRARRTLDAPRVEAAPHEATLDLGTIALGGAPLVRTLRILDAAPGPSRMIEGDVDASEALDPRLAIEGAAFGPLASGGRGAEVRVVMTPTSVGRLEDQAIEIRARVVPFGYPARGAPLRVHVEGEVIAREAMDGGVEEAPVARGCAAGGGRGGWWEIVVLAWSARLGRITRDHPRERPRRRRGRGRGRPP